MQRRALRKLARERRAGESFAFQHAMRGIGECQLEYILRKIDGDDRSGGSIGRRLHGGLLS